LPYTLIKRRWTVFRENPNKNRLKQRKAQRNTNTEWPDPPIRRHNRDHKRMTTTWTQPTVTRSTKLVDLPPLSKRRSCACYGWNRAGMLPQRWSLHPQDHASEVLPDTPTTNIESNLVAYDTTSKILEVDEPQSHYSDFPLLCHTLHGQPRPTPSGSAAPTIPPLRLSAAPPHPTRSTKTTTF
jgi:hypothetical protein